CPFHGGGAMRPGVEARSGCAARASEANASEGDAARETRPTPRRLALREITRSELSRHIDEGDLWIAIDGAVLDVSDYSKRHPGGPTILFAYAGRDVSAAFWQQNLHQSDAVRAMLDKFVIGRLVSAP